ncbi:DUF2252 domain-containing protein [Corynebacterium pacaense]|uniref:DUF2252 domain-containing protein n=1 Tax=Corynebacterium pacaense TaxID=1816684 RepID=UPI0015C44EC4|nr:DUF2252 domain-containing protein [Corynebacterium pacaense]
MAIGIYDLEGTSHPVVPVEVERARGKEARRNVPRSALGEFHAVDRDPVAVLEEQNRTRLPDLINLRRERMSASPFTFYRGSARLMAHDLAQQQVSGQQIIICGDAHINNFGLYASPERRLHFDLNDFDESAPGPWEWDVHRLVTSVVLGAEELGFSPDTIEHLALQTAQSYRAAIRSISGMSALDGYYLAVDDDMIASRLRSSSLKAFESAADKARTRTSVQAVSKMTEPDDHGLPTFKSKPPVLTRLEGLVKSDVRSLFEQYLASVRPDIRLLVDKHRLVDGARRVVGVGSVGTRCYVVLLLDATASPLILQIKEAGTSVITEFNQPNDSTPATLLEDEHNGQRVVEHQQILQAVSDPFLGWCSAEGHDFYVRQFRDMKGSVNLDNLSRRTYEEYVTACGLLLGRAHAQSRGVHWIAGYLGKNDTFDKAVTSWAFHYAEQVHRDFNAFTGK